MRKIILDVDNILAPLEAHLILNKRHGTNITYNDMTEWNWFEKFGITEKQFYSAVDAAHMVQEFILPYPDAIAETNHIRKVLGLQTIVASHRKPACLGSTTRFLTDNKLQFDGVYFKQGGKTALFEKGDLVIDDCPYTIIDALKKGCYAASLSHPWIPDYLYDMHNFLIEDAWLELGAAIIRKRFKWFK